MTQLTGSNFIGQSPSASGSEVLTAYNPVDNSAFEEKFYTATADEIDQAVQKASEAFETYKKTSYEERARFLETIADEIMNLGDELLNRTQGESALPTPRLQGERGRTCFQLKTFAEVLREGSWLDAFIDTAIPDRSPAPKPDLRKMQVAIGPVAVFGASNFPYAYSTAGGDTASALAAGNPVIVKGHESHLGTNELVSHAILTAAKKCNMPDGVFSMVNGGISVGQQLVKHPAIKAVGFTGSLNGGRALFDLASQREEPIPVYAEMGSTNPSFLLPNKLETETSKLAQTYTGSVSLGVGQFCTNPGLIIGIKSAELTQFAEELGEGLAKIEPVTMLNQKIASNYYRFRDQVTSQIDVETKGDSTNPGKNQGKPLVARVDASTFLENPKLHEEVFGPFTLIIGCTDKEEMRGVAQNLHGQLTGTVHGTATDVQDFEAVIDALSEKVGRIIFNGVPTGVEVCGAMNHGGPYPSSTDGRTTSVGASAITRFSRPLSYQDWPDELLPAALKDSNPLNIWRKVNGALTKNSIQ